MRQPRAKIRQFLKGGRMWREGIDMNACCLKGFTGEKRDRFDDIVNGTNTTSVGAAIMCLANGYRQD